MSAQFGRFWVRIKLTAEEVPAILENELPEEELAKITGAAVVRRRVTTRRVATTSAALASHSDVLCW